MITAPPRTRNQGLDKTEAPANPAAAPSETKISDSPALKATELRITQRTDERSSRCCFKRSTLTPEMNDRWPGTNGRTQGDRNEASPARKAIPIVMFVPIFILLDNQWLGISSCEADYYRWRLSAGCG